jgi:predicted esterase YcpF (UPF0227 family)
MRQLKILYIHGYGGNGNSRTATELQKNMGEQAIVYSPMFSTDISVFCNMLENIKKANLFVKENNVDIVIGSSMGGFIASFVSGMPKILINPCLLPSEQLPVRIFPEIEAPELQKYKDLESLRIIDREEQSLSYGLFSTNDELFSYRELFASLYSKEHIYTMNDGHRISPDNVKSALVPLIKTVVQ